jgi:cytochrome b561
VQSIQIWNNKSSYGLVAILLHWLGAVAVVGAFVLGVWVTQLTYYDSWYTRAIDLHHSIGLLLLITMLGRVIWRTVNVIPDDEAGMSIVQRKAAHGVHLLLYVLVFVSIASGYLISTADGRSIDLFGHLSIPAIVTDMQNQADISGIVHWYVALALITLTGLHTLAALKHHFIDRDRTLKKILGTTIPTC